MITKNRLLTQMLLTQWTASNHRVDKFFEALTPEKYASEIMPRSNTVAWILAHLTQVNDSLNPLLGLRDPFYPHLSKIISDKSRPVHESISMTELFDMWQRINAHLHDRFTNFTSDQWFEKHTSVSEADFTNEPHRNKLNVVISRMMHLNHHLGQLALTNKS